MDRIELLCSVAGFKAGDIVEIGEGEGRLSKKIFEGLDKHHYKAVNVKTLASQKELQGKLDTATRELDKLKAENEGLKSKKTGDYEGLVEKVLALDTDLKAAELKSAVYELQESLKNG